MNTKEIYKITTLLAILVIICLAASCSYDDSNDIDLITPNDSTQTAKYDVKRL